MNNSILFIGKWDENLQSLENQIINLQANQKFDPITKADIPDVKKYPLKGYDFNVWAIIGNVKPTVLLKSLISQTKILIFVFNISNENSLAFLKNGWGPIIENVNKPEYQERILIGTKSAPDNENVIQKEQIIDFIEKFNCKLYCEDLLIKTDGQNKNIIDHIKSLLNNENEPKIQQRNEDETIIENSSICYRLLKKQKAEIIDSPNAEGEIKIPTSIYYKGYDYVITKICDKAFLNSSIKKLSFSKDSQIEKIGDYAFEKSKLETLFIPKRLTDLSKYWNGGASNLSIVKIDPNNARYFEENGIIYSKIQFKNQKFKFFTYEINFVQRNMYHYNFDVNNNFTRIGCFAFYNYQNLVSFSFNNLINKMIDIGDYCFCCAENLRNIQISTEELNIGDYCFKNCSSLSSIIFYNIKNAKIGANAFDGCRSLNNFNLVTASNIELCAYCFNETNIKSINLYCSQKLILGDFCFNKCSSLNSITFQSNSNDYNSYCQKPIYKTTEKSINNIFIGDNCFEGCISLELFKSENIKNIKINKNSFNGCKKLENIILSKGKKIEIDEECFSDNNIINNLTIQSDGIDLANELFNFCHSLKNIIITTDKDLTVPSKAFAECQYLTNIKLTSKSTLMISEENFLNIGCLETIILRGNMIIIKDNCFNKCMSVSNQYVSSNNSLIIISRTLVEIGGNCFNELLLLKSIEIVGQRFMTKNRCFNKCCSLSSLTFSNSLEIFIGKFNFNYLSRLDNISFKNAYFIEINSGSFIECNKISHFQIKPITFEYPKFFIYLVRKIGDSKYKPAETFVVKKKETENEFVIKCFYSKFTKSLFNKMTSLMRLNNFSIQSFTSLGYMKCNENFCPIIFRDYVKYSLIDIINEKKQLSGTQRYIILLGITFGLKYLHSFKINHSHLTLDNILIDENFYPHICDFNLSNQNEIFSYKYDVNSYSIILYTLITGKIPLDNISIENINLNLSFIKDYKISEFFKRIWLLDLSFLPPFDDIFDEVKSEQYSALLGSNKEEVSKYLQLIEEPEQESESKENTENDENENEFEFESNEGIVYNLNNSNCTAEIIESPKAKGDIFIPKYIEFKSKKYKIIRISKRAFYRSSIESLSFSLNSFVESIDNFAFNNSRLRKLLIPNSLKEIKSKWILGAENLLQIDVDPKNNCIFNYKGVINYYKQEQISIIFIPPYWSPNRNNQFIILKSITQIYGFSFYKNRQIRYVESHLQSKTLQIHQYSFYCCENIEQIILNATSFLLIEENSFYNMKCLKAIILNCPNLTLKENFIIKCPSLEFISIEQSGEFTVSPNTFKGCESISAIKLKTDSSLKLLPNCFSVLTNLQSIEIIGKQILIYDGWLNNSNEIQTFIIHNFQDFRISQKTFYGFNNLTNIVLISNSSITIESNAFINCIYLIKVSISSTLRITILDNSFGEQIQTIKIKSEDVNINSHCFNCCSKLKEVLFENVKNATFGSYIFNRCSSLTEFNINASSNLILYDNCFSGSCLQSVNLTCNVVILGKYIFDDCAYINSVVIQRSKEIFNNYSFLSKKNVCVIKPILIDN